MTIGLGITVHNRNETAKKVIAKWKKLLPKDCRLVIVDDASEVPFKGATFRFESQAGIARAKNKCLELLSDCDEIFLADDDVYPIVKDWHLPYIQSDQPHLMYTFSTLKDGRQNDNRRRRSEGNLIEYTNPCGCLLYFNKICLETVGGFDEGYNTYSYEHVDLSNRIHNAGLTKFRFQDLYNSHELFYSMDWGCEVKTSVTNKAKYFDENLAYLNQNRMSSSYKYFKPMKSIVITTYFTGIKDPQRGTILMEKDGYSALIESCKSNKAEVVLLTNSVYKAEFGITGNIAYEKEYIEDGHRVVVSPCPINPYFQRWLSIKTYLEAHPDVEQVFCVDATDVEMQINPFDKLEPGYLYVGSENEIVNNEWMKKHHKNFDGEFYSFHGQNKLYNAGIVGGFRKDVLKYLDAMCNLMNSIEYNEHMTDMYLHNVVCYLIIRKENIRTGRQLHTEFKAYQNQNPKFSWFKHK